MPVRFGRRVGALVLAGSALATIGLTAWSVTKDLADSALWVAAAGLLCGFVQAAISVSDHVSRRNKPQIDVSERADDLANIVEEQWEAEADARQLRIPQVLPLSWVRTDRPRDPQYPGRVVRDRLAGRTDGRFDDVASKIAADFRQIHSGRLVVVGEPGSGKTVLTILLTLGLLQKRGDGEPMPVLLAASSWDPVRESLDDWVIRTLAESYYAGRMQIPQQLLNRRLVMPILDGLDEIPEPARRGAVRALNHAVGGERPVVVACRTAEYSELITDGAPTLRQAPVVKVLPVQAEDVVAHLSRAEWPPGTCWDGIYAELQTCPQGPVGTALSTPLMIALARTVYQRLGGDPGELLDGSRFDCRHAIEDHLTDRFIDAAYAPDRLPSGEPVVRTRSPWKAVQARAWLTFLAVYLHRHRERDLAWWLLSQRLLSVWVGPALGMLVGIIVMTVVSVTTAIVATDKVGEAIAAGAVAGGVFVPLAIVVWYATADRAPGRLSPGIRGSLGLLRSGFLMGGAVVGVVAVPVLVVIGAIMWITDGWSIETAKTYFEAAAGAVGIAGVLGAAQAVHNWLDGPPVRAAEASPHAFIKQDRRSSWVSATAAGIVVGLATFPVLAGILRLATIAFFFAMGRPGLPDVTTTIETRWYYDIFFGLTAKEHWIVGEVCVLSGAAFALLSLLTRAWPRFVITRSLLAMRGQLPFRLLAFLSDARQRQLIRQSGGTYQFRHIRLQERLADQAVCTPPRKSRRNTVAWAISGVATAMTALTIVVIGLPRDTSFLTLTGHTAWVNGVVLSPNGKTLATASDDRSARLWNVGTGQLLRTFTGHTDWVYGVVFSPNGRMLATASSDGSAGLWNVGTGQLLRTFTGHTGAVHGVVFSPNGKMLATASSDGIARLWNVGTGQLLHTLTGHTSRVYGVAFSPNGKMLATASSDHTARLWNMLPREASGQPYLIH